MISKEGGGVPSNAGPHLIGMMGGANMNGNPRTVNKKYARGLGGAGPQ